MRFCLQVLSPIFFPGWAHIRKNIHPELTNQVSSVIHECWKAGENKGTGKVKISADGVFERLEGMQSHNLIRLSELPVVGKIRAVYKSVGNKPQASIGVRKRGKPHDFGSVAGLEIAVDTLAISEQIINMSGQNQY